MEEDCVKTASQTAYKPMGAELSSVASMEPVLRWHPYSTQPTYYQHLYMGWKH